MGLTYNSDNGSRREGMARHEGRVAKTWPLTGVASEQIR